VIVDVNKDIAEFVLAHIAQFSADVKSKLNKRLGKG